MKPVWLFLVLCYISCVTGKTEVEGQSGGKSSGSHAEEDDGKKDDILQSKENEKDSTSAEMNQLCKKECLQKATLLEPCGVGCYLMSIYFENTVGGYPRTPKKHLLGNAIDQCWDGCLQPNPQSTSSCNMGCGIMQSMLKEQLDREDKARLDSSEEELSLDNSSEELLGSMSFKEQLKLDSSSEEQPQAESSSKEDVLMKSKDGGLLKEQEFWIKPRNKSSNLNEDKEVKLDLYGHKLSPQNDAEIVEPMEGAANTTPDDEDVYYIQVLNPQDYLRRLIFLNYLKSIMEEQSGGWRMDRQEMNFPLLSDEPADADDSSPSTADYLRAKTSTLIQDTSAAFNAAKENITVTLEKVDVRQFVTVTLIGICLGLLVSNFLEWLLCSMKKKTVPYTEDYYTLQKIPYNPVLPTYEECVNIDKKSLQDLHGGIEPLMTGIPKKNDTTVENV